MFSGEQSPSLGVGLRGLYEEVDILQCFDRIACGDVVLMVLAVRTITCTPDARQFCSQSICSLCTRIHFNLPNLIQNKGTIRKPRCVGQKSNLNEYSLYGKYLLRVFTSHLVFETSNEFLSYNRSWNCVLEHSHIWMRQYCSDRKSTRLNSTHI